MTTGKKSMRDSVTVRLKAREICGRASRVKKVLTSSWLVYYYKETSDKLIIYKSICYRGFTCSSVGKERACSAGIGLQCRRARFDSWVRRISWRRAWQPTPGFLLGESHGQSCLAGYSPRVRHDLATKPPYVI